MRQAWVNRLPKRIDAEMRQAVERVANDIADAQRRLVPVDEGDLRESITVTMDDKALRATITAGGPKTFWARWIEFGTRMMRAQPFFFPVWRSMRQTSKRRLSAAFRKAFKTHGGSPA